LVFAERKVNSHDDDSGTDMQTEDKDDDIGDDNADGTAYPSPMDVDSDDSNSDDDDDEDDSGDGGSGDEDGDDDDVDADSSVINKKDEKRKQKLPEHKRGVPSPVKQTRRRKPLYCVVADTVKRLEVNSTSDVARKCVAFYGEELPHNFATVTDAVVCSWTQPEVARSRTFFFWPQRKDGVTRHSSLALMSDTHNAALTEACRQCVKHGDFLTVLQGGRLKRVREELLSLLCAFVRLEVRCVTLLPLRALVAAYGATMSHTGKPLSFHPFVCSVVASMSHTGKTRLPVCLFVCSVVVLCVRRYYAAHR
jgi:hypothetical protein